jgi:uncharacterized cupin superfamily protein
MWSQFQAFVGQSLRSIEKLDYSWFFRFDPPLLIVTEAPWRLVTPQGIAVTDTDHGQQFGLPEPVDAATRVLSSLPAREVQSMILDKKTGDLRVNFAADTYLHFLQMSCGYEAWRADTAEGEVICLGGGDTVFLEKGQTR